MKALKIAYNIKKVLNVEYKHVETAEAALAVSQTPDIALLTGVAQGQTDATRNGNQVRAKSLLLRGQVEKNASATYTYVRFILFQDTSSDGAAPSASDLLDTAVGAIVNCPLNKDFGKRFRVLRDKTIILNSARPSHSFKHFVKLGHVVEYQGTDATQASTSTGHVYLMLVSNEATNTPSVNSTYRFSFIDN